MLILLRKVWGKKAFFDGYCVGTIHRYLCYILFHCSNNISNTRDSDSSGYPNTEKRVENTTRSGLFLTKFEVFG